MLPGSGHRRDEIGISSAAQRPAARPDGSGLELWRSVPALGRRALAVIGTHRCEPRVSSRSSIAGMVTAEAALVLPLIGLVSIALCWLLTIGIADVRLVDGARDAARALARGDDRSAAVDAARRSAGSDSVVTIHLNGGLVTVVVTRRIDAPGWLLVPMPGTTVRATSTVEVEDVDEP
jgi:hypothetical protein